jgi:hypothetical protein
MSECLPMTKHPLSAGTAGRTFAAVLLTLGLWTAAAPAPAAEGGPMDPRAVEKLQRMSEVLTKAQTPEQPRSGVSGRPVRLSYYESVEGFTRLTLG